MAESLSVQCRCTTTVRRTRTVDSAALSSVSVRPACCAFRLAANIMLLTTSLGSRGEPWPARVKVIHSGGYPKTSHGPTTLQAKIPRTRTVEKLVDDSSDVTTVDNTKGIVYEPKNAAKRHHREFTIEKSIKKGGKTRRRASSLHSIPHSNLRSLSRQ